MRAEAGPMSQERPRFQVTLSEDELWSLVENLRKKAFAVRMAAETAGDRRDTMREQADRYQARARYFAETAIDSGDGSP